MFFGAASPTSAVYDPPPPTPIEIDLTPPTDFLFLGELPVQLVPSCLMSILQRGGKQLVMMPLSLFLTIVLTLILKLVLILLENLAALIKAPRNKNVKEVKKP
jgi:hypothetical protein